MSPAGPAARADARRRPRYAPSWPSCRCGDCRARQVGSRRARSQGARPSRPPARFAAPCGLPAATDLPRRPARRLRSGPARPAPERSARPTRRPTRPAPASAAQPPCQLQTLMILSAGATAPASRITASPTKFQTVPPLLVQQGTPAVSSFTVGAPCRVLEGEQGSPAAARGLSGTPCRGAGGILGGFVVGLAAPDEMPRRTLGSRAYTLGAPSKGFWMRARLGGLGGAQIPPVITNMAG